MRCVVLWVPDWSIAAAVSEGLVDAAAPSAVHDGHGLVVVSAAARAQGVRRGMRRRHAQRVCPDLVLLARDEARDARAFEPVAQAVEAVIASPSILRPGLVLADAAGPVRHAGSENALGEALVGAVARDSGAEAYVGIADGLLTAVLAARASAAVPPQETAAFLAPQPLSALRFGAFTRAARAEVDALVEVLGQLGVRTLGEFARLPAPDVLARFGAVGARAHGLASGAYVPVPSSPRPEGALTVARELDPPVERSDAAAFAARALAEELAVRLHGRACGRLRVTARTTDGNTLSRLWTVDSVLRAAEATDRVRWQLDGWLSGRSGTPPSAPLHFLEISAEDITGAVTTQERLWGRPTPAARGAERAIVRLQGMLGNEGVWLPVLQGGRDPRGRVRLVAWNDEPAPLHPLDAPWPGQLPSPAPSTVLDQPEEVQLLAADGAPVRVDARGEASAAPALLAPAATAESAAPTTAPVGGNAAPGGAAPTGPRPRRLHAPLEVVAWAGPWPISERWWGPEARRSAWVQVVPAEGPALLLSTRDCAWWLEGLYD